MPAVTVQGGRVTVTGDVVEAKVTEIVDVTSLIGTKEEQNADAFNATSTALQSPTLSRRSSSARGITPAKTGCSVRNKETNGNRICMSNVMQRVLMVEFVGIYR